MFNVSKENKEKKQLLNDIQKLTLHQKVRKLIEKAKNLMKLDRHEEASGVLEDAEKLVWNALYEDSKSLDAYMLLIGFYFETNQFNIVKSLAEKILEHKCLTLEEGQRQHLEHLVNRVKREKPYYKKNGGQTSEESNYTTIYSCQNCGSIINYVTIPCYQCQWYPDDLMCLSRSIILSSRYIEVPMLLSISRKIIEGQQPSEIVGNLEDMARRYYELPEDNSGLRHMLELLEVDAEEKRRNMLSVRECHSCGKRILFSNDEECSACEEKIDWPEVVRFLVCMDNLMWLFERRLEIDDSKPFSEFICLLSFMTHHLLHKQEPPTQKVREYALVLLSEMGAVKDLNIGGFVTTADIDNMKIQLVDGRMTEENQSCTIWLFNELSFFVEKLKYGIQL